MNKKYILKKDAANVEEAIRIARNIVIGKREREKVSKETFHKALRELCPNKIDKNYVYLIGKKVTDLIILEWKQDQFIFRPCTRSEWTTYFKEYIANPTTPIKIIPPMDKKINPIGSPMEI